jgi:glycosyltransferase involved in cell wall biosynthesis
MPKVVRAIARLNIGGPARHAVILSERLAAKGFDTLLVHGTPAADEGSFEGLLTSRAVRAVRVPGLGRRVNAAGDLVAFWHLLRLLFREAPDILHTHTAKAGAIGRVAGTLYNVTRSRERRCILVHTFHGNVLSGYFGAIGTAASRSVERMLGRLTDRIVTVSERQRDEIVDRFQIGSAPNVSVVPLGLDLDELVDIDTPDRRLRIELGWESADFVVGYVGRLVSIKNLGMLISAFAMFGRTHPNARLLVVGDGELRRTLERQAQDLGVQPLTRFLGWRHDLPRVYGAMDVVALTSRNEGTPVALIEALAAGVPVIATDVGGVADVVRPNETGLLIPTDDASSLACALRRLADDAAERRTMGQRGRRDVANRFGAERLVADVAAMYDQLLRERNSGARF